MDLRDDAHTQLVEHIATLRIMAKQEPPGELIMNEMNRYFEQAAMVLEAFILPKIKDEQPILDMRTGTRGNSHKVAEYVGVTTAQAAADDGLRHELEAAPASSFMPPSRK